MDRSQVPADGGGSSGRRPSSKRSLLTAAGLAPRRRRGVFWVLLIAGLLTALALSAAPSGAYASAPAKGIKQWQQAIAQLRMPGKGCFDAAYPAVQWQPARCVTPPKTLFDPAPPPPPGGSPPPQNVGGAPGATDYSAAVSGVLSSATGSFDSESSGVTETGPTGGNGAVAPNQYSLQLNAKPFTTTACNGGGSSCLGFEQFVYDSNSNDVYVQDWLNEYDAPCPSGWATEPLYGHTYCVINSPGGGSALTVAAPTAAQLASVTLTGNAVSGGNDSVVMTVGGTAVGHNTAPDSYLNLASEWNTVEFGVFGDGYGSQAAFSNGTDLKVRVTTHSGTTMAPSCVQESFTEETNNLNFAAKPAIATGPAPGILTEQNTGPGVTGDDCGNANGWGEIHLNTFGAAAGSTPLTYNFQASGDFELADSPPFNVQTRLVPFSANPSLSVSRDVAAQVGRSQVAVCDADPLRLVVNRQAVQLANGQWRGLPGGGSVSRQGNAYLIRDGSGDTVQAAPDSYLGVPYLDVSVGLGRWPTPVSGLLANAGNNASAVESRSGTVLAAPFQFGEFYKLYGNSWRVTPEQDLLAACGTKFTSGTPAQNYEASNLPPKVYETAHAICVRAGVQVPAMLDACTLDVAVLGDGAAAVYRTLPTHVIWGKIVG
jgi:hypothetical protein